MLFPSLFEIINSEFFSNKSVKERRRELSQEPSIGSNPTQKAFSENREERRSIDTAIIKASLFIWSLYFAVKEKSTFECKS